MGGDRTRRPEGGDASGPQGSGAQNAGVPQGVDPAVFAYKVRQRQKRRQAGQAASADGGQAASASGGLPLLSGASPIVSSAQLSQPGPTPPQPSSRPAPSQDKPASTPENLFANPGAPRHCLTPYGPVLYGFSGTLDLKFNLFGLANAECDLRFRSLRNRAPSCTGARTTDLSRAEANDLTAGGKRLGSTQAGVATNMSFQAMQSVLRDEIENLSEKKTGLAAARDQLATAATSLDAARASMDATKYRRLAEKIQRRKELVDQITDAVVDIVGGAAAAWAGAPGPLLESVTKLGGLVTKLSAALAEDPADLAAKADVAGAKAAQLGLTVAEKNLASANAQLQELVKEVRQAQTDLATDVPKYSTAQTGIEMGSGARSPAGLRVDLSSINAFIQDADSYLAKTMDLAEESERLAEEVSQVAASGSQFNRGQAEGLRETAKTFDSYSDYAKPMQETVYLWRVHAQAAHQADALKRAAMDDTISKAASPPVID